jgi:hypothetical protein
MIETPGNGENGLEEIGFLKIIFIGRVARARMR